MKCAQAGALASETRMEFVQGTNYANVLPNDALSEVLARAMRKSGGYEYTPEERAFADTLQKTVDASRKLLPPDKVQTDQSEAAGSASSDVGDVSWVVPTAQFTAATFVPGVGAHTWQAAACAGSSIGRKGMVVAARTLALGGSGVVRNARGVGRGEDGLRETPRGPSVDNSYRGGVEAAARLCGKEVSR